MKTIKLICSIAITCCIILMAYIGFQFLSGDNSIHTGINFLLVIGATADLLTFRLSVGKNHKIFIFQASLTIALLISFVAIYFNKELLLVLWNYLLGAFVLKQGLTIITPIKSANTLLEIMRYITVLVIVTFVFACIFLIGSPLLYSILFYGLLIISLSAIVRIFAERN